MTSRYPLVLISGALSELPDGDSVFGASVALVSEPSGLYIDGGNLGIDGSAIASGNAALVDASVAIASGNAALALIASLPHLDEAEVISLIVGLS